MAKANGVRWYRHVLRRDDGHVLRKALEFEVRGKRKPGQPKKTWKMQVEKESKSVGLEKKDAMNRARWKMGVREIAAGVNPATPIYRDKTGSKLRPTRSPMRVQLLTWRLKIRVQSPLWRLCSFDK